MLPGQALKQAFYQGKGTCKILMENTGGKGFPRISQKLLAGIQAGGIIRIGAETFPAVVFLHFQALLQNLYRGEGLLKIGEGGGLGNGYRVPELLLKACLQGGGGGPGNRVDSGRAAHVPNPQQRTPGMHGDIYRGNVA